MPPQALSDAAGALGLLAEAAKGSRWMAELWKLVRSSEAAGWPHGAAQIGKLADGSGAFDEDPPLSLLVIAYAQLVGGGKEEPIHQLVDFVLGGPLDLTPDRERVCAGIMWAVNHRGFRDELDRTPQLPFGQLGAESPEQERDFDRRIEDLLVFGRKLGFGGDGHFEEDSQLAAKMLSLSFCDQLVVLGQNLPAARALADAVYDSSSNYPASCAALTRQVMTSGLYHQDPLLGSIAAAIFSANAGTCASQFVATAWFANALKHGDEGLSYVPASELLGATVHNQALLASLAWQVNWEGFRTRLAALSDPQ